MRRDSAPVAAGSGGKGLSEQDVMRITMPGGGSARVLIKGEFGPAQIRALIRMLDLTAEILAEDAPVAQAALARGAAADTGGADG